MKEPKFSSSKWSMDRYPLSYLYLFIYIYITHYLILFIYIYIYIYLCLFFNLLGNKGKSIEMAFLDFLQAS